VFFGGAYMFLPVAMSTGAWVAILIPLLFVTWLWWLRAKPAIQDAHDSSTDESEH
jgi:hypothetical protein